MVEFKTLTNSATNALTLVTLPDKQSNVFRNTFAPRLICVGHILECPNLSLNATPLSFFTKYTVLDQQKHPFWSDHLVSFDAIKDLSTKGPGASTELLDELDGLLELSFPTFLGIGGLSR